MTNYTLAQYQDLVRRRPDMIPTDLDVEDLTPAQAEILNAASEFEIQRQVFTYCTHRSIQDPRWRMVVAIPNGQVRPGQRIEPGLQKGFPDIGVAWPCGGYHGLYIELKRIGGTVRPEQEEWLNLLAEAGYAAVVAYGYDETITILEEYFAS